MNVPLGALYAAQHIYNIANLEEDSLIDNLCDFILQNRTGLSSASARSYLNELLDLRSAPSVKQMLIYYVNSNYELETTAYSQFQSTLNSIGFPQGDSGFGIKNLSVSNGGVNNYISCLDYLLNRSLTVGTGILTDMIFFPITILLDFDYFGFLGLLPGLTSISSYTRIFPFRTPGQSIFEASAVYTKKYGYMPDQNHYYYNYQYNAPNYLRISDDDAGSFIDWKTKITKPIDLANTYLGEISFESFLTPRIMFVPSVSSLHYKYSLSSLSSDERKANFITAGIDMNDIPFNGYRFHKDTSSYHTEALYYDYQWIDRMQDLSITPAPDTLNTTYCFTISDADPSMPPYSVEWSISDTYVATIDSSTGVLTPNLGGTAQVYADVSYLNGHLRLTRTVYIPEEEFPGFPNYTLKADAGIILLDNTFSGDYTITATQLSAVDARFKPYMKCHWGLKTSNTAPIVWTEDSYNVLGNKLYYFCNIPELSSERRVYFYVSFRNQLVSPTYSVFCLYPPIHFQLDGEGNLYAEGIDDPITQLKSDISEIQYVFHCLDKEFTFGHWPSSAEFCLELLTSECFVNMVKEMRPWGEKTQLLIPYSWNTSEDETMQFDLLTIQFDETL